MYARHGWNITTSMWQGTFPAFPGFSQLYRCQAKLPSHLLAGATTSNGYCLIEMYHNRWVFYCTYYTYYISTVYVCTYFKCHMYTILVHISNTCMIFTHTKIHIYFYTCVICIDQIRCMPGYVDYTFISWCSAKFHSCWNSSLRPTPAKSLVHPTRGDLTHQVTIDVQKNLTHTHTHIVANI